MSKPQKPTPAGLRMLGHIAAGRDAFHGLYGMSEHGGAQATWCALRIRGYIDAHSKLTDAGRAVVDAEAAAAAARDAAAAGDTPEAPGALRNRLGGSWALAAGGRVVHAWEYSGPVIARRFYRPVCGRDLICSDKPILYEPTCPRCLNLLERRQVAAAARALRAKP